MWSCAGVLALLACAGALTRDQFYPHGHGLDQALPRGGEIASPEIPLKVPVVFYGEAYESIFVNNFGLLTFRADMPTFLNIEFPLPYPSIAAFYTNVNTTNQGTVFYRETNETHVLSKAEEGVQNNFHDYYDFKPTSVFIVTWLDVTYTTPKKKITPRNSYQVAIITNGTESFAEFLYPEREIQWYQREALVPGVPDAKAQAGFVSEDGRIFMLRGSGSHQIRNIVSWSNTHEPGKYVYRIGRIPVDDNIAVPDQYDQYEVELEEESKTCTQSGPSVCHVQARCVDYQAGICCQCSEGYYGNGKTCIKDDVPLRIHGKINGVVNDVNLNDVDIQSYVVVAEGRAYTALSLVPGGLGSSLQSLNVLGGVVGWLFAKPSGFAKNGYQLTGAVFNHTADIWFPATGDRVVINQEFLGQDVFDQITLETDIRGSVPVILTGTKIQIGEYEEQYTQIESGVVRSESTRTFVNKISGEKYEQRVSQTFRFNPCRFAPSTIEDSTPTTLRVTKNYLGYEHKENIVRYGMSNKIYPLGQEDPCIKGRSTCGPHSSCVVRGDSFTCVCQSGFTDIYQEDATVCIDIDECEAGTHNCDSNAQCHNYDGGFQCRCHPGFVGNGTTCERQSGCLAKQCNSNAQCIDSPGAPSVCVCSPGFTGDGEVCYQITNTACAKCSHDASCEFSTEYNSFICECRAGYYGDGYICYPNAPPEVTTPLDRPAPEETNEAEYNETFVLPQCDSFGCSCPPGYTAITDQLSNQLCRLHTWDFRPEYPGERQGGQPEYPGERENGQPQYPGERQDGQPQYPGERQDGQPQYPGERQNGQPQYPGGSQDAQTQYPGERQDGQPQYPGERQDGQQQYPGGRQDAQPQYPGERQDGQPQYPGERQDGQPQYPGGRQDGQPQYPGERQDGQPQYPSERRDYQPEYPGERQDGQPQYPGERPGGQPQYPGETRDYQPEYPGERQDGQQEYPSQRQDGQLEYPGERHNGQPEYPGEKQESQPEYPGERQDGLPVYPSERTEYQQEYPGERQGLPANLYGNKQYTEPNSQSATESYYQITESSNQPSSEEAYLPSQSDTNEQSSQPSYQISTTTQTTEPYYQSTEAENPPPDNSQQPKDNNNDALIQCTDDFDCPPNAECLSADDSSDWGEKHCVCPEGYEGDAFECTERPRPACSCGVNAHCVSTGSGEFICVCDPGYRIVDGFSCRPSFSCNNNTDCEYNAECKPDPKTNENICQCVSGYKKDQNDACIPDTQLCNGALCAEHASCLYDADLELNYCQCDEGYAGEAINHCTAGNTCDVANDCDSNALCTLIDQSYECVCLEGYSGDGYNCIADQNCRTDPNLCDPHASCQLRNEAYICECNTGYSGDGSSCLLNPRQGGNFLVASDGASLYRVPFRATPRDFATPFNSGATQIAVSVDVDCELGWTYWGDVGSYAIKRAAYDGSGYEVFLNFGVKNPEGIAVDWSSRNIFWTDSEKLTIEVANLDTRARKVLFAIDGISNPRGIAVHPQRGKVFWSDWMRTDPKIEWANMDGTERGVFLDKSQVALPNSLAIDWVRDRLCYADAGLASIKCVGIDSLQTETIAANCSYPFGLAINGNRFYWTDWKTLKIEFIDVETQERGQAPMAKASWRLYGVAVARERCPAARGACAARGGCGAAQLCLPAGRQGRTCVDPDNTFRK